MKREKKRAAVAALVLAVAVGGAGAFGAGHVRLEGHWIPKNGETVSLTGQADEALPVLEKMPRLRQLDLRQAALTPETLEALEQALPDCTLLWNVALQGQTYSSDIEAITLSDLSLPEAQWLATLPELTTVDAEQCKTAESFEALAWLSRQRPDMTVSFRYPLAGQQIEASKTDASLKNVSAGELEEALVCLPKLKKVNLSGKLPEPEALSELQEQFPEVALDWVVEICGKKCSRDTKTLNLSGKTVVPEDLNTIAGYLPCLTSLDLGETVLPGEYIRAFQAERPTVSCRYAVSLCGKTFSSDAEEVDLTGCPIADLSQLESELGSFSNLKKLILSGCGQPSEALDALDRRLPETRVVWTVQLGELQARTDDTWFMPVKFQKEVTDRDLTELKYCRDMICVDVGHMKITNCDWAANMPNLQYLVIADTQVSDISPLAEHKKLVFLEVFLTKVTDLTPLESCTGLDDLNLSYLVADATPISHMTWLKRLWWTQPGPQRALPAQCQAEVILPDALPDTEMVFHSADSVGAGWRKGAHYYEMRDILGMFYIDS